MLPPELVVHGLFPHVNEGHVELVELGVGGLLVGAVEYCSEET